MGFIPPLQMSIHWCTNNSWIIPARLSPLLAYQSIIPFYSFRKKKSPVSVTPQCTRAGIKCLLICIDMGLAWQMLLLFNRLIRWSEFTVINVQCISHIPACTNCLLYLQHECLGHENEVKLCNRIYNASGSNLQELSFRFN